jgi:hypothetical protein
MPVENIRTGKFAEDLSREGTIVPMGEPLQSWSYARNRYGALACYVEDGKILNMTQLFKSGEIWGIDADSINKNNLMKYHDIKFGFFPSIGFETIFVWTLNIYLKFANEKLKLTLPLKFIAGATDVLGYRMAAPSGIFFSGLGEFGGKVVENHITFEGMIEDYSIDARSILRPFFEYVWEECGLKRPDKENLER